MTFLSFNVLEYLFALGREPHTSDFWDMSLKSTLWEIRCYLQTEPGCLSKLENLIYFVGCDDSLHFPECNILSQG